MSTVASVFRRLLASTAMWVGAGGAALAGAGPGESLPPLPVITLPAEPPGTLERHFGWRCDAFLRDDYSRYRGRGCGHSSNGAVGLIELPTIDVTDGRTSPG